MLAETHLLDPLGAHALASDAAVPMAPARPGVVATLAQALREHWPEYLIEAAALGTFMVAALGFGALLEHPGSPARAAIADPFLRRVLMGIAMGATAIGIIYSRWGQRSGAHMNPAITLTFLRLGKVRPADAFFYIVAQFAGGLAGLALLAAVLGALAADPAVNFVATVPGPDGPGVAFLAEALISAGIMAAVLVASNSPRLMRLTGLLAGTLVFLYIAFEAPISGMSMNPARTLASAVPGSVWTALWIYFLAPPLGMLAAAEIYRRVPGARPVLCAKLHHTLRFRCIFRCGHAMPAAAPAKDSR
jgi:aquaporin Z